MQSSDAIRTIKERINIVQLVSRYVDLKSHGGRFVAPCPFHLETKPSFYVFPDEGSFYCFGCQASGDIFEFYGKINGLDFKETLEQLAAEAGVELSRYSQRDDKSTAKVSRKQLVLQMHQLAAKHFRSCLFKSAGAECMRYLEKRGISTSIIEQFGLGWAERDWHSLTNALRKNGYNLDLACEAGLAGKTNQGSYYDRFRGRLIFPINSQLNKVIAFGGRIIGEENEAKYINSADTPIYQKKEHLYGLAQARRGISAKGFAILTEGYIDVLTLHQYGYTNGVGVLGTALTEEQIKRLSGFTSQVLLIFDGDAAGRKAALRSCEMLLTRGLSCKVVRLPEGEDIDSLLRGSGESSFEALRKDSIEGLRFCIEVLQSLSPRDALAWAKKFLAQIQLPELVSKYASILAQTLQMDEDKLRGDISGYKTPAQNQAVRKLENMRDVQIMIYAVRYPDRLTDLRDLGADMVLTSPAARELWNLIEQWGAEEVFYHLDETQKNFWQVHRGPTAAPLTSGDKELSYLKRELSSYYTAMQKASLSAALAARTTGSDFAADLEYLRALQETLEKKHE